MTADASSRTAPTQGIDPRVIAERRLRVFILLSGFFLGAMAMLNIIGITKFIHIGPLELAVGVLPYPLTFLCTDLISEFYGRRRANFVVFVGLLLNIFVVGIIMAGHHLPSIDFQTPAQRITMVMTEPVTGENESGQTVLLGERVVVPTEDGTTPVTQIVQQPTINPQTGEPIIDPETGEPIYKLVDAATGQPVIQEDHLFDRIYISTISAVLASMIAYIAAQFIDVYMFHFWKRLTRGRYLWLRNNGSTLVSQLVDSVAVVSITFAASVIAGQMTLAAMLTIIGSTYLFKMVVAMLDTIPIYIAVHYLKAYLQIDPTKEHGRDAGELAQPAVEI